jgi:hypothetical protein
VGTVHKLSTSREPVLLGQAVTAYVTAPDGTEFAAMRRVYGGTYRALLAALGHEPRSATSARSTDPLRVAPHYWPACLTSSPERPLMTAGFPNGSCHRLSAGSGPRTRTPDRSVPSEDGLRDYGPDGAGHADYGGREATPALLR